MLFRSGVRRGAGAGATVWLVGVAGPSGHALPGAGAGAHEGAAVGRRAPQSSVPGGPPAGERSEAAGATGSGWPRAGDGNPVRGDVWRAGVRVGRSQLTFWVVDEGGHDAGGGRET